MQLKLLLLFPELNDKDNECFYDLFVNGLGICDLPDLYQFKPTSFTPLFSMKADLIFFQNIKVGFLHTQQN